MKRTICVFATVAAFGLAGAAAAAGHGHGGGPGTPGEMGAGLGRGGGGLGGGLGPGMSPNTIGGGAPGLGPSVRGTARQNSRGDAHAAEVAHDRANSNSALTASGSPGTDNDAAADQDKTSGTKSKPTWKTSAKLASQRRLRRQGPAHASTQGVAHANTKASL